MNAITALRWWILVFMAGLPFIYFGVPDVLDVPIGDILFVIWALVLVWLAKLVITSED